MPRGMYRSRSLRRVFRKTPGGVVKLHYRKRKGKAAHCSSCRSVLQGVPRQRPFIMRQLPKTMKRPERPYGGVLCSRCMRQLIKDDVRKVSADV